MRKERKTFTFTFSLFYFFFQNNHYHVWDAKKHIFFNPDQHTHQQCLNIFSDFLSLVNPSKNLYKFLVDNHQLDMANFVDDATTTTTNTARFFFLFLWIYLVCKSFPKKIITPTTLNTPIKWCWIYIQGQRAICWMFFISIFIFHFRLCLWVFYFTHSFLSRPFFFFD